MLSRTGLSRLPQTLPPASELPPKGLTWVFLFAILAPRSRNIAQDASKNTILEPTSSKIPLQHLPRQPPGPFQEGPDPQKNIKSDGVLVVFTLRPFLQRSYPESRKMTKMPLKMVSSCPSWGKICPSWRQLGSNLDHIGDNLAPTSPMMGPSWP